MRGNKKPAASSVATDVEQAPGKVGQQDGATTTTTDYKAFPADPTQENYDGSCNEKDGLLSCLRGASHLGKSSNSGTPATNNNMPPLNAKEQKTYERLKKMQYWMDESVKICGRPVGLDPIVGLLPVVGDCASAAVSLVLVARAAPQLSRYTVIRMLANVWIDTVTGTVPLLGDLFDVGWKANQRNVAIFEDHMKQGRRARQDVDKAWLIGVILFFFAVCCFCAIATIAVTVVVVLYIVHVLSID